MGATVTEKILAAGCGRTSLTPGEIIEVQVDRAMIHDNNAALVIMNFERIAGATLWAPEKVSFVIDHHSPSTSAKAVGHQKRMREFAKKWKIGNFFDCGDGISHVLMLEEGLACKGEIVVGTDSHTTGEGVGGAFATGIGATEMAAVLATGRIWLQVPPTIRIVLNGDMPRNVEARDVINVLLTHFGPEGAAYRAVEFHGLAANAMTKDERLMASVMCMEMGAKNVLFVADPDPNAIYERTEIFDLSIMEPTVAVPSLPTNGRPLSEIESKKIMIDQAAICSCSGGLLSDISAAARILKGKKIAQNVRLLVIPASRKIFNDALKSGYIQILHDAGAIINSPSCGACGAHDAGILAEGEVCISTSPRNMEGRMGAGGIVYLAGASTVAASALKGYIASAEGRVNE